MNLKDIIKQLEEIKNEDKKKWIQIYPIERKVKNERF